MKVLVALKRAHDLIDMADAVALEAALGWKESGLVSSIMAVSIGDNGCEATLRYALALGADSAVWIKTQQCLGPFDITRLLRSIVQEEKPDLVLLGKKTVDYDDSEIGPLLAGLLQWPQGIQVSECILETNSILVTCAVDSGIQTLRLSLPAVITTDMRLNEPRCVTIPDIVAAKNKPLVVRAFSDIENTSVLTLKIEPIVRRRGRVMKNSIHDIMHALQASGYL